MGLSKIFLKKDILGIITLRVILSAVFAISSFLIAEKFKYTFSVVDEVSLNTIDLVVFIILYFITFIFGFGQNCLINVLSWVSTKKLIMYLIEKVMRFPNQYFADKEAANVWTGINVPSQKVATYLGSLTNIFSNIIIFAIYLFIIFRINMYAGCFVMFIIPIYIISTIFVGKKISFYSSRQLILSREIATLNIEFLESMATIKTKNEIPFFIDRIERKILEENKVTVKHKLYSNYWENISSFINSVFPVIILFFLLGFSDSIEVTLGELIILYAYVPLFCSSFKKVYDTVSQFFATKPSILEINELLKLQLEKSGDIKIDKFEKLTTYGLEIKLKSGRCIHIPDFSINRGDKVFLSGESGIGKSTFFNVLTGMVQEYNGSVKVNDKEINGINVDSLRNIFGISFQNFEPFGLNLVENIRLSNTELDISKFIKIAQIETLAEQKTDTILNVDTLSGGEKARINLAQNLAKNPDVILIDESLGSVEEHVEKEIIKSIISTFSTKTIIYISHRTSNKNLFDKLISF